MFVPQPVVGCTVDARCTRCRETLPHTVLSLKENHLDRVLCSECHWEHAYKPPRQIKASPVKKVDPGGDWQRLHSKYDKKKVKSYSMSGKYTPETWINHPTLGEGVVQKVTGVHTVEVLFESGTKLMRCNGGLR